MQKQVSTDVEIFWKNLITGKADFVEEVGHTDMGRTFNKHAYEMRLKAVERALIIAGWKPKMCNVFEAAFGVGFYLNYWKKQGCPIVRGVDISETAQKNVQPRFPFFDLRAGNIAHIDQWHDWQELKGTIDLVTAIDVIYHIVDEKLAAKAVNNLGALVRHDGLFLVTDKFTGLKDTCVEGSYVVRRPLSWYQQILAPHDLQLFGTIPMFWCMDPPVLYGHYWLQYSLARVLWVAMRLPLKYWRRNSSAQLALGNVVGVLGKAIDDVVVPRLKESPNLTIGLFKKA